MYRLMMNPIYLLCFFSRHAWQCGTYLESICTGGNVTMLQYYMQNATKMLQNCKVCNSIYTGGCCCAQSIGRLFSKARLCRIPKLIQDGATLPCHGHYTAVWCALSFGTYSHSIFCHAMACQHCKVA